MPVFLPPTDDWDDEDDAADDPAAWTPMFFTGRVGPAEVSEQGLRDPGRQLLDPRARRYASQTKTNVDILLADKQDISSVLTTIQEAANVDASPAATTLLVTMVKATSGSGEDTVEASFTPLTSTFMSILEEGGGITADETTLTLSSSGVMSLKTTVTLSAAQSFLINAGGTATFSFGSLEAEQSVEIALVNAQDNLLDIMAVLSDTTVGHHCTTATFYVVADAVQTAAISMAGQPGGGLITTITGLTATNAVLTTPNCGTPSAITLTNGTGLPPATGLTAFNGLTAADVGLTDAIPEYNAAASANRTVAVERLLGFAHPMIADGRLTLETGVAVSSSDQTDIGTLRYTPFVGNRISLFDGTRWKLYAFSELSLSLSVTSGKNYDVFLYDNSGTLTLELSAAWTNDTTRADALTTQDGVVVKSGATTRKWLGAFRASDTNKTSDADGKRLVSNAYHQVPRSLMKLEATNSWSTATSSWRAGNNDTNNCVQVMSCRAGPAIQLSLGVLAVFGSSGGFIGISSNSTTAPSTRACASLQSNGTTSITAVLAEPLRLGYSAFTWMEKGSTDGVTATSFFGDNGGLMQSGLTGTVMT